MKYSTIELEILKKEGKQGLKAFHMAKRKCSSTRACNIIESKKYKQKYKLDFNNPAYFILHLY